ncbi:MAG: hypothetical protein KUG71_00245 [Porticoccaceae bacterium]|nr:hypothetical protein [Porticoccaceae bacterium]
MSTSFSVKVNPDWTAYFKENYYRIIDENVGGNPSGETWSRYKLMPLAGGNR